MQSGFVYVFGNRGLTAYKVGMTTRAVYIRRDELQREYGTVHPFEIASRQAVADPAAVEALAHRILARYRLPRSELFACDLGTCTRAVHAAAVLVLDRPWWLRAWHWLTLPRPGPVRRSYRRSRYRRGDPAGLVVVFLVVGLVIVVSAFKPDLPPWMPDAVIRAAYLVERLRY
jgi:hypothetical protein